MMRYKRGERTRLIQSDNQNTLFAHSHCFTLETRLSRLCIRVRDWCTIVEARVLGVGHSIGSALVSSQSTWATVELEFVDVRVPLDSHGALNSLGEVGGDTSEDGNLSLDNLFVRHIGHVSRDILDKSFLGTVVKHLLPELSGELEVLVPDLGQE